MSLLPPGYLPPPPFPSIGPTGLSGLTGAALNGTRLPYASGVGSLLSGPAGPALPRLGITPTEIGALRGLQAPTMSLASQAADRGLANQLGRAVGSGGTRGLLPALPIKNPGLVKGGLWGLAGSLGANAVDRLNVGGGDSVADQFATGAVFGGLSGGAFGGVGALVGAPVGGALNVLGNAVGLWGNEKPDEPDANPVEIIATAMQTANLDAQTTEDILTTYDTLMALAEQQPEGDARDAARQQAFDQTSAMVLSAMQQQQAQNDMASSMASPDLLALQAQASQIFQPLAEDIRGSAGLYAQAMAGIRDNLPPEYRAIADATVSRELSSADRLANAYQAQAALTPVVQRLTQYQQDQQAFANQLFQQQQAQMAAMQAGGGAGQTDVLSALAG